MLTLAILMTSTRTPLIMALITLIQTVVVGLMIFPLSSDSWGVLLFMLVYFGGVMVLFIYVCSLSQMDNTHVSFKPLHLLIPLAVCVDACLSRSTSDSLDTAHTTLVSMLSWDYTPLCCVMIVYLLIALVVVVKVSSFYGGALRQL